MKTVFISGLTYLSGSLLFRLHTPDVQGSESMENVGFYHFLLPKNVRDNLARETREYQTPSYSIAYDGEHGDTLMKLVELFGKEGIKVHVLR